jgi:hypothetical protein
MVPGRCVGSVPTGSRTAHRAATCGVSCRGGSRRGSDARGVGLCVLRRCLGVDWGGWTPHGLISGFRGPGPGEGFTLPGTDSMVLACNVQAARSWRHKAGAAGQGRGEHAPDERTHLRRGWAKVLLTDPDRSAAAPEPGLVMTATALGSYSPSPASLPWREERVAENPALAREIGCPRAASTTMAQKICSSGSSERPSRIDRRYLPQPVEPTSPADAPSSPVR